MSYFYGDGMRWWHGVVEEIGTDIPQLGKVKVRIRGIHGNASELSTEDLPYAQCIVPTTEAGTSGFGANPNLMVGAHVVGFFLDGAMSQLPVIFGSIPKIELPSQEQVSLMSTNSTETDVIQVYTGTGYTDAYIQNASFNTSSSNLQIAWEFFRKEGFPAVSVAAMLGNFMHECAGTSDLIPVALNPDDKGLEAYGIAQWRNTRSEDLFAFAEKRNTTWKDFDTQLNFVIWELKEHNNQHHPIDFQKVTDVAAATVFFQHKYEIPEYEGGFSRTQLNQITEVAPAEEQEKKYSAYTIYGEKVFRRSAENERIAFAKKIHGQFTQAEEDNLRLENIAKDILKTVGDA